MLAQAHRAPIQPLAPPPVRLAASPSPIGSVLDGRYRVIELLDEGAMGRVYLGERLGIGRRVAIKFLRPELTREPSFLTRFGIEAQVLGRLCHPHCVSVIDFGNRSTPYLIMDLVEGVSLRALIAEGPVPVTRAVAIARQMLAGLAHAHSRGIVHRDAKPENVVLESALGVQGDHVRLLDFGLAKLREGSSNLTKGMLLGTPSYLSPEQLHGGDVDERADIYTCGIVLYEMLSGRTPFEGESLSETLLAQKQMPPPPLSAVAPGLAVPAALERVIRRALEKSAADRFGSALEMIAALDDAVGVSADEDGAVWLDAIPEPETAAEALLSRTRALIVKARMRTAPARATIARASARALAKARTRIAPAQARAWAAARTLWVMTGQGVQRARSWWRGLPRPARQLAGAAFVAFLLAFGLVSWAIVRG